jgi:UDP-N-acetylmuramyl pentapeptide phosphotransferase/UDP-N-acetylglucosamine-1-phosphate transferase
VTRSALNRRLRTARLAGVTARGVLSALDARPPGGSERWLRLNHRGASVSLLEGPAFVTGSVLGVLAARGLPVRVRSASLIAAGTSGIVGAYDDVLGSSTTKGLRGHLQALADGEITSGTVKVAGIGVGGLMAGSLLRRGVVDRLLAGVLIAGTANLVNLLDLRPGRAFKASALAGVPLVIGPAGDVIAAALGAGAALLPGELGETTMLGDCGANSMGALVGVAAAATLSRPTLVAAAAGVVGLTLLSERVSFSAVIESHRLLAALDALGRSPTT